MRRLWQAAIFLVSATIGINLAMPHESLATTTTVTPFSTVTPAFDGIWRPAPGTTWQWQLNQQIDTSYDVQMYDIDLFDTPQAIIDELHTAGRVVICYFSAGSREAWRPDAALFPMVVLGNDVAGWAGEKWLDNRRIDLLGPIMTARLELAVRKGCDGVEPDNVEAYTNNSGFPLTYEDQIAYNRWLATEAHKRRLSVGLKNDLEQIPDLVGNFDWALNEQCFQFNECELLQPFVQAGKAVFGVEYEGNPATFCPKADAMSYSWLKKNPSLDAWQIPC
jgi:Glycoside-hydrolase family GH114